MQVKEKHLLIVSINHYNQKSSIHHQKMNQIITI